FSFSRSDRHLLGDLRFFLLLRRFFLFLGLGRRGGGLGKQGCETGDKQGNGEDFPHRLPPFDATKTLGTTAKSYPKSPPQSRRMNCCGRLNASNVAICEASRASMTTIFPLPSTTAKS